MSNRKTKEEKEKIIFDYTASGLSMTKWCKANGIATSTLAGWINGKKAYTTKPKTNAKFVEFMLPADTPNDNAVNIIIDYKSFKITVPNSVEFHCLRRF